MLDFWKAESSTPTPLVFVIHGGGWRDGTKERVNRFVDIDALLKAGISVVTINHRLISHAEADGIELRALAETWPDESTRELLSQRVVQDASGEARGAACSALGGMHFEFGRILPKKEVNGLWTYLDPLTPISREHIERAAERVGIRPDDIDATVASLSAYLGWDITRGAKPSE